MIRSFVLSVAGALGALLVSWCGPVFAAAAPGPPPPSVIEARGTGQPLSRHWVDLDGDGFKDLVVVTGRSTVPLPDEEDRVGALVSWLRVTPSFLDRRDIQVFRQTASGLQPWGAPLTLPGDCSAVDVADIDGDGSAEILFSAGYRVYAFTRATGSESWSSDPKPLCDAEMLLGTSRAFVPAAPLALKWAEDRPPSLLLSTTDGIEIRRTEAGKPIPSRASLLLREGLREIHFGNRSVVLFDPAPRVVDADGDGTPDLFFRSSRKLVVYRGHGDGLFDATPLTYSLPMPYKGRSAGLVVEDVNGDGLLDLATFSAGEASETAAQEKTAPPDSKGPNADLKGSAPDSKGPNADVKDSEKEPRQFLEVRRGRPGFQFPEAPDTVTELPRSENYKGADFELRRIDADKRLDLVVTRVSASFWQVARVMTTKKMTLGISFEAMLQRPDGSFAPSAGKPFETKLKIDLHRGISSTPTGPRGDFNGDGLTDLIEFPDEPKAEIHLTRPDGAFPSTPDWSIVLPRAPADRELLDIEDFDGDGRSDAAFFNPDGDGFAITLLRSRK